MPTYAKWGNPDFAYGDTDRLWGEGNTEHMLWAFEVDWDGDGVFDGSNEANKVTSLSVTRGRPHYLRINSDGEAIGFHPIPIGKCTFIVVNDDDRYSSWNVNSPLYPNVEPGKDVRIRMKKTTDASYDPVFYGVIDKIVPIYGKNPAAKIICSGTFKKLTVDTSSVKITTNVANSDAIGSVLDNVGWPARWGRSIEASGDTMPYWWASKRAATEIRELADASLGFIFSDASGQLVFYDNTHTAVPTITLTQSELLKKISFPQVYETVRNRIIVYANSLEKMTTSVLWESGEKIQVDASGERTVFATYTYDGANVPAVDVLTPVANTDYTANTSEDGSGTDITSDVSVTLTDFGETGKLLIENNGTQAGYVTIQLRGNAIAKTDVTFKEKSSGSADRLLTLNLKQLQNVNTASDFAVYILSILSAGVILPEIRIQDRPEYQFGVDLFDVVNLSIEKLGLNATDYYVAYIKHKSLSTNLQSFVTEYHLEPYTINATYWTFPATVGVTTIFGV